MASVSDVLLLRDYANTPITGKLQADFALCEAYEADTPSMTAPASIAEIGDGEYGFSFTPASTDAWVGHVIYDANGLYREFLETYTAADFGGGEIVNRSGPTIHSLSDLGKGPPATGNIPVFTTTGWRNDLASAFDVRAFGAVGDGLTDDGANLQTAFNAAAAAGRAVYIPGGCQFLFTSTLTLPGNTRLCGDGEQSILLFRGTTGGAALNALGDRVDLDSIHVKGRTEKDLVNAAGDGAGIRVFQHRHVRVVGCTFSYLCVDLAAISLYVVDDALIHGNHCFENYHGQDGADIGIDGAARQMVITSNRCTSNVTINIAVNAIANAPTMGGQPQGQYVIANNVCDCLVGGLEWRDTYINSTNYGFTEPYKHRHGISYAYNGSHGEVIITGNSCRNGCWTGIYGQHGGNSESGPYVITNNIVSYCGFGDPTVAEAGLMAGIDLDAISAGDKGATAVIANNVVEYMRGLAPAINVRSQKPVSVIGNQIRKCSYGIIDSQGTSAAKVADNVITVINRQSFLTGAIDAVQTSILVANNRLFTVGSDIQIGSEKMTVSAVGTGVSAATRTLTVTRGVAGTTAAAHADLDVVYVVNGGASGINFGGTTPNAPAIGYIDCHHNTIHFIETQVGPGAIGIHVEPRSAAGFIRVTDNHIEIDDDSYSTFSLRAINNRVLLPNLIARNFIKGFTYGIYNEGAWSSVNAPRGTVRQIDNTFVNMVNGIVLNCATIALNWIVPVWGNVYTNVTGRLATSGPFLAGLDVESFDAKTGAVTFRNAGVPGIPAGFIAGDHAISSTITNGTISEWIYNGTAWVAISRFGILTGSKTFDWASIATAAEASTTVTVTGAVVGDFAEASMSVSLQAMKMSAFVSAADTVTVVLRNDTGAPIDLASGTLRALVRKG